MKNLAVLARSHIRSCVIALAMVVPATTFAEVPVALIEGLGDHTHPIATGNPEAQRYFDQGLVLTFGFNHPEAIRSFEKAHELDPKSPMPLWGKALALGPNYNVDVDPVREKLAWETIHKALELAANGPDRERDYVNALSVRYSSDDNPDLKQLARNYATAMGKLAAKYPDDLDAATVYAESRMNLRPWQLWTLDHQPAEGTLEIVALLESVLARDPLHPGANHLYIHAVEASAHPEWALPSAQRLEAITQAAGHLVHMPSHIYMLVGDYRAAAARNETAAQVDHSYIQHGQVKGVYPVLYYHHNLHFIAAANAMLGRHDPAKDAAARLFQSVETHAGDIPEMQTFITEYFSPYPLFIAARFRDWDAVTATKKPDDSLPLSNGFWRYARGLASSAKGDSAGAAAERAELARIASDLPEGSAYGFTPGATILDLAMNVLDARIAALNGDIASAVRHLEAAIASQDQLPYNEPADWYYPVRETLGAMLLLDGQAARAEEVFRTDLAKHRRNPRSLFGLWQALLAQNRPIDAELVQARFQKEWAGADMELKLEEF